MVIYLPASRCRYYRADNRRNDGVIRA